MHENKPMQANLNRSQLKESAPPSENPSNDARQIATIKSQQPTGTNGSDEVIDVLSLMGFKL